MKVCFFKDPDSPKDGGNKRCRPSDGRNRHLGASGDPQCSSSLKHGKQASRCSEGNLRRTKKNVQSILM